MSMEEDLVRLVKATVKAEVENQMRTRTSEFIGRGGDVTIGGMGNIWIQPGVNKRVYINGIGFGVGDNGELLIYTKGGIREVPV